MVSPYVIGFISQKGGVAKSTLARAAAVAITKAGYRVRLADLDPQQFTSLDWYKRRINNGGQALASVDTYGTAEQAIQSGTDMRPSLDYIILDAPGRSSDATAAIARQAHLVIQPATGTLDDLKPGVLLFHELTKRHIPREKMLFVLTRTGSEAEEVRAKEYIRRAGYSVLETTLRDQNGYKYAQDEGKSAIETPWESLNERAQQIIREILGSLAKLHGPKDPNNMR
jgi:chromosome partitioning protein